MALGLDAAVDLGGAVEVAELALDDLGAADQEVGGDHRVGLAAGAFDEGGEAVDVALALAEAGGLLGGGAVQAGGAGGVLDGLEAQAEGLVAAAGGVERVGEVAEDLGLRLALGAVREARAEHADQQRGVAAEPQGALQLAGLAVVLQGGVDRRLEQLGGLTLLLARGGQAVQLVERLADAEHLGAGLAGAAAGGQQQRPVRALGAGGVT